MTINLVVRLTIDLILTKIPSILKFQKVLISKTILTQALSHHV